MRFTPIDEKRTIATFFTEEKTIAFAAIHILNLAKQAIEERGTFSIALSGGSTPKKLYDAILAYSKNHEIDWSKVRVFWSDERCVSPDHPESNFAMAMKYFEKEPLAAAKKFRMRADSIDLEASSREYDRLIRKECFDSRFDVCLLGIGEDGHTASLFPYTKALHEEILLCTANHVPEKNTMRMTLTFPCINMSRHIMVLAFGKKKADVLKETFFGPFNHEKCPAQRIWNQGDGSLFFLVDDDAMSFLEGPVTTTP